MHWSIYEVCTVLSGVIVLLIGAFGTGVSTRDRLWALVGGIAFVGYGFYVANQDSGIYYFPMQIFVLPVVSAGYLGYRIYQSRTTTSPVAASGRPWAAAGSAVAGGLRSAQQVSALVQGTLPPAGRSSNTSGEARFCGQCGARTEPGASFCIQCGTPVRREPGPGVPVAAAVPLDLSRRLELMPPELMVALGGLGLVGVLLVIGGLRAAPGTVSILRWTTWLGLSPLGVILYVVCAQVGLGGLLLFCALRVSRADHAARAVASVVLAAVALGGILDPGAGGWAVVLVLLSGTTLAALWLPGAVRTFMAGYGLGAGRLPVELEVAAWLMTQVSVLFGLIALGSLIRATSEPAYVVTAVIFGAQAVGGAVVRGQLMRQEQQAPSRSTVVAVTGLVLGLWMTTSSALALVPMAVLGAHLWLLWAPPSRTAWLGGAPGAASRSGVMAAQPTFGAAASGVHPASVAPTPDGAATGVHPASVATVINENSERFHPAFARLRRAPEGQRMTSAALDLALVGTTPLPRAGEREVGRWLFTGGAMITVTDAGTPIDAGGGAREGRLAQLFSGGGELLLTDRRLVAVVGEGDTIVGAVGNRMGALLALVFALDRVEAVSVELKPKLLGGGSKEGRLQITTLQGTVASLVIETVEASAGTGPMLYSPYPGTKRDILEMLVAPVVAARRPAASEAEQHVLGAVERGLRQQTPAEYAVTFVPG